ncbi:GCN5-related N-acetyltransferas-like protein [Dothidotthia symphoricarpi CBS 119687]|uniref:GCN5-related N-acetyltransferas-like protein n=1 Tax=Dothidotthia symphoricarpi CBS 119687 TaxID=1392245 RepID=A0A6A6AFQ0_9PLEO|nr:GCN5-related N-acetyltransferas-like protein [Dothidotthia symphoricarpi CBS 119687]KAF2130123.1 GCN5-related N-acetyltransferas-like protein [Dothidotthia symphoricarpi CBS 119687]
MTTLTPPVQSPTTEDELPPPLFPPSRITVRPMHPLDAVSMAQHATSPMVAKYMSPSFPHPYTPSDATHWINLNLGASANSFGIYNSESPGIMIGNVGLRFNPDANANTAEVGFWLGDAYWGRGYITEVLEKFTAWCFSKEQEGRGLCVLWGGVLDGNVGSMRCFEKAGYERERVLKDHYEKGGKLLDMHIFGAVKGDWEERRARKHVEK